MFAAALTAALTVMSAAGSGTERAVPLRTEDQAWTDAPATAADGTDTAGRETEAAAGSGRIFGVTTLSAGYMRARPDYESSLENQALMGTPVEIIDSAGYWLKIRTPEPYVAWITSLGIARMDSLALAEYIAAPKYICTATWTEVLASPAGDADRICDLVAGDLLRISRSDNGKPLTHRGFVGVTLPSGEKGFVRSSCVADFTRWADTAEATPDNVIRTAMKFLGTPYMWGGASSCGLDCSGLVRLVYFMNGLLLKRNASQQASEGEEIDIAAIWRSIAAADAATNSMPGHSTTTAVAEAASGAEGNRRNAFAALKKGDLLFFGRIDEDGGKRISHVGLYIGGGRFIHASQVVRISSLDSSQPDYYTGSPRLVAARRIVGEDGRPYSCGRVRDSRYYFP